MMAVAYFQVHAPAGSWPIQNHGELAVLYGFTFLYLTFAGGGKWSLDYLFRTQRPTERVHTTEPVLQSRS